MSAQQVRAGDSKIAITMKSINIRNIDPEVLTAIKRLARSHHRSLQSELRAILEREARLAPNEATEQPLQLHTVRTGNTGTWTRDEIYGDEGR